MIILSCFPFADANIKILNYQQTIYIWRLEVFYMNRGFEGKVFDTIFTFLSTLNQSDLKQ